MEEVNALAKNLRFVITLDTESLSRVDLPEAFFQLCKNVLRSKGLDC